MLRTLQSAPSGIITEYIGRSRKNHRAGSADTDVHSVQRPPVFCRVNHYRPPKIMQSSDELKSSGHKSRSIKTRMSEFGVEELDWAAQSPDLKSTEPFWN